LIPSSNVGQQNEVSSYKTSKIQVKHFLVYFTQKGRTAVAQWLRCYATNRKVAGSIPANVIGFFFHIKSFRSHYGPGFDSASHRNEYQEYFLGVRRPVCKADKPPPSCPIVTKSGNLNFLGPSGPIRACNGSALPLPLHIKRTSTTAAST